MGMGPRKPVAAPLRQPPRMGLIASSATNQGPNGGALGGDDRWELGLAFQPEQCGDYAVGDPCATVHETLHEDTELVKYDPFAVQVSQECTPTSGVEGLQEAHAATLRALDRFTPKAVEHEFWTGDFSATTPGVNNYLANPASEDLTPVGGLAPIIYGLTELQRYLADCGDGGRGMIHAPRRLVSLWESAYLVHRDPGSLIVTDLYENIIVPGVGYTGGSPRGTSSTFVDWGTAPASGTVTYTFPGYTAVTVAFDATLAALETALEAVLGAGTIASIAGSTVNVDHLITWGGAFDGFAPEPSMTTTATTTSTVTGTVGNSTVDSTGVTAWAYATSLTQVRLSAPKVTPDVANLANELGSGMFVSNSPEFFGFRLAAVTFDGCCHAAVEVDLCSTCCVPEGGS